MLTGFGCYARCYSACYARMKAPVLLLTMLLSTACKRQLSMDTTLDTCALDTAIASGACVPFSASNNKPGAVAGLGG